MWRCFALVVSTLCLPPAFAQEQDISLVVGFAPGGTTSTAVRVLAEAVESSGGPKVLVENKPGAGGFLAAEWVRQQHGSVLYAMSSTSSARVSPYMGLVPVGVVAGYRFVAVARKDAPATLAEYMARAVVDERLRTVGTAGAGSIAHLIGERLFSEHDVTMVHVPYQGSAPAITAVLGGHVALAIVPMPDFLPFKDGLRIIAATRDGFATDGWIGLYAPPGTSRDEVARLAAMFRQASERAGPRLVQLGFRAEWRPASEFEASHRTEYTQWSQLLAKLGIKP